ncbi:hypothetical protein FA13DRAFT_1645627 [Coprinellus micaceus]|uniref:Uncharacterized protein n=1 Tax=Coprinellus micaceus TaxID=71717 RepID=A0A4Y7SE16_COPMI|nr:hypothetical protein FA13DRAFT_1645627 [Coprinellus micaceus]
MSAAWKSPLEKANEADKSRPPPHIHVLQRRYLRLSIPAGLSCVVYDEGTGELILVAVRRFCGIAAILDAITLIVRRTLDLRNTLRLQDPGWIVHVGFTAGSRRDCGFGFARNLASQAQDAAEKEAENRGEVEGALTYFWLRTLGVLPAEVTEDVGDHYGPGGPPRFRADWPEPTDSPMKAALKLSVGGRDVEFEGVERPPGCAVFAEGYAKAVHFEPQAHDWAIGWNHCRQGKGLIGGHFYLSDYGIEMIAAEDTAWSWRPKLLHTTGLSNAYPGSPFRLEGMAFITPIRLGVAYARWLARS